MEIFPHPTVIGKHDEDLIQMQMQMQQQQQQQHNKKRLRSLYYGHSSVFVKNIRGGRIFTNDPAIASWSVDAIRVIRDQLYRAGSGELILPLYEHWPEEARHFSQMNGGGNNDENDDMVNNKGSSSLPTWATEKNNSTKPNSDSKSNSQDGEVAITDLPRMATEVNELLNSMELQMEIQRQRRLSKLKQPRTIVRSWYLFAAGIPAFGYVAYRLFTDRLYIDLSRHIILKLSSFYQEHFSEPLRSM